MNADDTGYYRSVATGLSKKVAKKEATRVLGSFGLASGEGS